MESKENPRKIKGITEREGKDEGVKGGNTIASLTNIRG